MLQLVRDTEYVLSTDERDAQLQAIDREVLRLLALRDALAPKDAA